MISKKYAQPLFMIVMSLGMSIIMSGVVTAVNTGLNNGFKNLSFDVFPNPSMDLIAIQANGLVKEKILVELFSSTGKLVRTTEISAGRTIAYFDVQTLHQGAYNVRISCRDDIKTFKIIR